MASEIERPCEEFEPALAAYALGEYPPDPDLVAHLAGCSRCRATLESYSAVALLLPASAELVDPAPELRSRILRAAGASLQPFPPQLPRPTHTRRLRRYMLAATFAAVLIALLGWNIQLQGQVRAQQHQLALSHSGWDSAVAILDAPDVHGYVLHGAATARVWITGRRDEACLVAEGLPPLPAGHMYQAWLSTDDRTESGGTFGAQNGSAWSIISFQAPPASYKRLWVTLEATGGSNKPTGQTVLEGTVIGQSAGSADSRSADRAILHRLAVGYDNMAR